MSFTLKNFSSVGKRPASRTEKIKNLEKFRNVMMFGRKTNLTIRKR